MRIVFVHPLSIIMLQTSEGSVAVIEAYGVLAIISELMASTYTCVTGLVTCVWVCETADWLWEVSCWASARMLLQSHKSWCY